MEKPVAHGWAFSRLATGGQAPMQSRRKLLIAFSACFVAMGFVVASVLADELLGVLTKVDVEGKKITVVDKDDKETVVTITDDTEQVGRTKNTKLDLKKLESRHKKAQDAEKKINVKVTHEKNVASKIEFPRGKGTVKKNDN
jgi:uncharacterized membrane protein